MRSFIDDAYKRTVGLLREKKDLVDKMAQVCVCTLSCFIIHVVAAAGVLQAQLVLQELALKAWLAQPVAPKTVQLQRGGLVQVAALPGHR